MTTLADINSALDAAFSKAGRSPRITGPFTQAEIARIRDRHEAGASCKQIAAELRRALSAIHSFSSQDPVRLEKIRIRNEEIIAMRRAGVRQKDIAAHFRISASLVSYVEAAAGFPTRFGRRRPKP